MRTNDLEWGIQSGRIAVKIYSINDGEDAISAQDSLSLHSIYLYCVFTTEYRRSVPSAIAKSACSFIPFHLDVLS